jgi:soluble lytic murein transglycosylase
VQHKFRIREQLPRQLPLHWALIVLLFSFSFCILGLSASESQTAEGVRLPIALRKTQSFSPSLAQTLNDVKLGVNYYEKERYVSALEALPDEKRSSLTSIGDYILYYRAKSYFMQDRGSEALRSYKLLLSQFPESPLRRNALMGESLTLLKVHEPKMALAVLQTSELGSNSEVQYYQARALEDAGEKEKAINAYLQIYAKYPDSSFSSEAMGRLRALSPGALSGKRNYEIRLQRAENLIKSGNSKDARVLLLALGKVQAPESKSAAKRLLLMGEAEYRLNRASSALVYIRKVNASYPELNEKALYLEGSCLRKLDKESSFLNLRDKALQLYPHSSLTEELFYSVATYYDVNYDSAKSRKAYKALYDNFPKGKHAERALWKIALFSYFEKNYDDAALTFWKYLLAYPNSSSAASAIYWMGRCYQKLGDFEHAKDLYFRVQLLANNSFYGQCAQEAQDSLEKMDKASKKADLSIDFSRIMQICEKIRPSTILIAEPEGAALKVIERARQLQQAELPSLAISELRWGIRRYPEYQESLCYLMSRIHESRDDYNESIASIRRAFPEYISLPADALPKEIWRLLYPMPYWEIISEQAVKKGLDPKLILSVIRQESEFEEEARSKANARGLMQIIPSTGKKLAKNASSRRFDVRKLFEADTNITLGVKYLASLLQQYGREELALAAYNAGDSRVDRWLKEFGGMDKAEFVEQIPFSETRGYVKQVLSNKSHYGLLASTSKN